MKTLPIKREAFWRPAWPLFAILTLVLAAPFEAIEPVASIGAFRISSLELVLLAVFFLLGAYFLITRTGLLLRTPLTWPALLLGGVMLVSAFAAAEYPGEALRFAGRFLAGFGVFLLVVNVMRHTSCGLQAVCLTAAFSGTTVGVIALLEYGGLPGIRLLLDVFQEGPFFVGSLLRASSTLQYPTIASMFLEITFGLTLGLLISAAVQWQGRLVAVWMACLLIIAAGIIVSLTRGGLLTLGTVLLLVNGLYAACRGADRGLKVLLSLSGSVGILALLFLLFHSSYWLRVSSLDPGEWYRASFQVPSRLNLNPGETREIDILVSNQGKVAWNSQGESPFRISYHWLAADRDTVLVFEGDRTSLPRPVAPGGSVGLKARVTAPPVPGEYRLAWDIVQEQRLWFSSEDPIGAFTRVRVEGVPLVRGPLRAQLDALPLSSSHYQLGRVTLWKAVFRMLAERPWLGVGPGNFRLVYGDWLDLKVWDHTLHANNTYLDFLAGTGIMGGLLFLWMWGQTGLMLKRAWNRNRAASFPWVLAVTAATTAIAVHGLVDHFFPFTPTYVMIWLTLGLAASLVTPRSAAAQRSRTLSGEFPADRAIHSAEKGGLVNGLRWICPDCRQPLKTDGELEMQCLACRLDFPRVEGVWRCLTPQRAAYFQAFIRDYEAIRRAEGRGTAETAFYRALPFQDLSKRHSSSWKIRSCSYRKLLSGVVSPLETGSGEPLRILDLGAGNGWLSGRLAGLGHAVAAVDLILNAWDGLGAHVHYHPCFLAVQADCGALPFEDAQFGLAIFNASFHYAVHYEQILAEAGRVLKSDGLVVIMDSPLYRQETSGRQMLQEQQIDFERRFGFRSNALPSEGFLTNGRLEELQRSCGFQWQILYPFYGLKWALRPWKARLRSRREPAHFALIIGRKQQVL